MQSPSQFTIGGPIQHIGFCSGAPPLPLNAKGYSRLHIRMEVPDDCEEGRNKGILRPAADSRHVKISLCKYCFRARGRRLAEHSRGSNQNCRYPGVNVWIMYSVCTVRPAVSFISLVCSTNCTTTTQFRTAVNIVRWIRGITPLSQPPQRLASLFELTFARLTVSYCRAAAAAWRVVSSCFLK